jgi:hypothetical protein
MAKPGRPERNRTARSFRQLRRFHHVNNSDKVFGTHTWFAALIRLETEKLGRESKRPDAASAAFTAVLVSLGQTAAAVLSADNESVRLSDMVLILRWDAGA